MSANKTIDWNTVTFLPTRESIPEHVSRLFSLLTLAMPAEFRVVGHYYIRDDQDLFLHSLLFRVRDVATGDPGIVMVLDVWGEYGTSWVATSVRSGVPSVGSIPGGDFLMTIPNAKFTGVVVRSFVKWSDRVVTA